MGFKEKKIEAHVQRSIGTHARKLPPLGFSVSVFRVLGLGFSGATHMHLPPCHWELQEWRGEELRLYESQKLNGEADFGGWVPSAH